MDAARIARLLPEVYGAALHPDGVLAATLAVMEAMHAPAEAALRELDAAFDPRRAADPFLRLLAGWMGLDDVAGDVATARDDRRGPVAVEGANLRELVAAAAELARDRGTAGGLRRFLEIATGVPGFVVREAPPSPDGAPTYYAAEVVAPAAARAQGELIALIVAREKPAFTTVTITHADPA